LLRLSWLGLLLVTFAGCKKYLDVPLSISNIAGASVFQTDNTAAAALNSIYAKCYSSSFFDGTAGVGFYTGLYTDEWKNQSSLPDLGAIYGDGLSSALGGITGFWSNYYSQVYSVNLAVEGLSATGNNLKYRNQWLGEAYFLRGLLYFYLTNLYKDVPLVLSSDYLSNNQLARSAQADVYKQIVSDLKQAQSLLDSYYHNVSGAVTTDRGRPNRYAATALLSRVYLYTQDWKNAESQADSLIKDVADYQLPALSKVFLVNNPEVIWGVVPYNAGSYAYTVKDANAFYLPAGKTPSAQGVAGTLSDSLVKTFEAGDARYTNWVGIDTVPASGNTPMAIYYYPGKYKVRSATAAQEVVVLFRLAEQYLVRAEARAQQNNMPGALTDLNMVRARASLPASAATTQAGVLTAILHERRVELFTEVGHRFFDLRRTGNLDAVMNVIAPLKGGAWSSFKAWWPIPVPDIQNNLHLTQTPGY
jgi:hypothetical protein